MKNMRSFLSSLLLLACILCGMSSALAQGTSLGTIRGRVTDPTGAAVQNASVKVTDLETNITRELTTDDEGEYEVAALKTGTYRVTVTGSGFASKSIRVTLTGSEPVRADAALEVGGAVENVEVVSEAGIIQTESSTIAGTITNQQLVELPRDSRDIYSFLFLNPNITQGANEESFKFIGSQSYGAAFSLDGQRSNGGVFGTATTSQPSLEAISELTVLSNTFAAEYAGVANIRVQTKRGTKDFHGSLFYNNRNSALAAWTIQDKINRANFVPSFARPDYPKPYFNLNEAGGSLNGPVPFLSKGRTFFMGAYERRWTVSPTLFAVRVGPTGAGVPGQRILDGDFSHLTDANKPNVPAAVLPLLTPAELANNTVLVGAVRRFISIPQRLLNPSVSSLIDTYFPSSSPVAPVNLRGALSDFAQNVTSRGTRDLVTGRIDHDFSDNDKFYAVYNYQNNPRTANQFAGAGYPAFGLLQNEQTNHTLSLSYTRVITPSLVNELRGGFNRQNHFRGSSRTLREFLTSIGFSEADITAYGNTVGAAAIDTPGHMAITIQNFAGIGAGGRSVNRTLDQKLATFGDTLTWIKGRHTIKGGLDIVRNSGADGFVANRGNPRGLINYTNAAGESPTSAFARFLMGLPPTTVSYVDKLRGQMNVSNWEQGYFVQDEFKVHPNVTLNFGLRYELFTPFVDSENLLVNFDPNFTDPTTGRKGRFIVPTRDVIPQLDANIVSFGVVAADEIGLHPGLINPDKNNLAPRAGVAWRITENTVLRGGYGVFYPTPAAQNIRDAFGSTPFNQGRTRRTVAGSPPLGGFPGGLTPPGQTLFTGGVLNTFGTVPSANAIPVDLQQPRVQQFNVTVERELGWRTGLRLSYLASRMSGLVGGTDLNLIQPSDIPFGTSTGNGVTPCDVGAGNCVRTAADLARLPFPELGDFLLSYGNFGSGRSHALQFEVNRRFASGLSFNVSYTLLDQKGSGFDVGASSLGGTSYNQFNPESDFGREAFVSRHRLVSYGVFELPFGRGKAFGKELPRAVDAALGGWQLSWNMFAKSGTSFTPFWTCNNCGPVTLGNIASTSIDAIGGFNQSNAYRATIVSGTNLYVNSGDQFFNPAAFGLPPTGADVLDNPSVARRNVLTGPGTWGTNLGLRKFFRFTETTRLEIGADLNNAFNHPLRSPLDINFANLGNFDVGVNPANLQPIITNFSRNIDFGRIRTSFNQEGIDNRRLIRVRARFTF